MSVTFAVDYIPTGEFNFSCYDEHLNVTTFGTYSSYDDAVLAIAAHKLDCDECNYGGCYANAVVDVDVSINLSNMNALMILGILGIDANMDDGIVGSLDGADFLSYAMIALAAERDNAAVPSVVESNAGCATMVHCGLPEGYVEDTLSVLADLATEAMRLGRRVVWS